MPRSCLIDDLLSKNFNVQLQFTGIETSWEDHGDVEINSPSGELLFSFKGFQHNHNMRNSVEKLQQMALMAKSLEGKL